MIDTTLERDIDLLIMEEFASSPEFAKIFLETIGIFDEYTIKKVIHSKTDAEYGESDVVIIIERDGYLHAIQIEDKIDAIAMKEQHSRYHKRAEKDIANGEYQSYSIVMVAPQNYIDKNSEAKKYENHITYEQLKEYFSKRTDIRSQYKLALVERAITTQKNGYQWEANPYVVEFCNAMYGYQKENFPGMSVGTTAWWPTFKTVHKHIDVIFKANKGHCDLQFKCSKKELYDQFKDKIYGAMTIEETGKSSAIRIDVNPIYFENGFDIAKNDVHIALKAIHQLIDFANNIDMN